jgi:putative nucleotidyltransferase with HDIG domain
MLSQGAIERALSDTVASGRVRDALQDIYVNQIYAVGVLNQMSELPISPHTTVLVRAGDKESVYDRNRILDIALANARLLTALNQLAATQPIDVDFCYNIGRHFILPNLWVDMAEYNRRVKEGLQQLTTVKEVVSTGDVIVSARQKVTDRQEEILQEMAQMLRADAARRGWWMAILPVVARVVLVLAVFSSLYFFLRLFRREVYRSNPKLLALFLVFAVQMFLLYFVDLLGLKTIYIYPVAVLPIMVTILFDAEIGILSTLILAILLGILHRFSFSLALLVTAVGFVGCMTSRRVRKRSDFYRIMLSSALAYVLLILIVENLKLTPSGEVLTEMGFGLTISILSVMAIMVLLPVFESMFGLTTDTTLLELSDLNHPLLKRLSIEAPGTYHHSISVGNLCETAAEAIGANSLLARVGAYYHDIGKIEVPEYFVENQFSVKSRHDALTPSMSALILSSHVKKGRLLGEEADIPDDVLNFIEEHHGTMVMSYFYHRAKQVEGDDANIDKYRYPGPKPQTRETGIAMLADAVEAASRTLDDPKPARIDALIQKIINDRFQSGELDQCPLTLRDLAKIKQAFAQVLIAAFHHRVKYPAERGE